MLNSLIKNGDSPMDFDLTTEEVIDLIPEYYQQAKVNSDRVMGQFEQWDTYINTLAFLGFEAWLHNRMPELTMDTKKSPIWQSYYTHVMKGLSHVKVGELTLCVIGVEGLEEDKIKLPRAILELSEWTGHFYIIVEVLEEEGKAIIKRFIRGDKLRKYRNLSPLSPLPDWSYQLPLEWFDEEMDRLLLNLRYLTPTAINSSVKIPDSISSSSLTKEQINKLLSYLPSPDVKLWEYLSWEQGAKLLNSRTFLEKLYQWQTQSPSDSSLLIRLQEMLSLLTKPAINTAVWLQGELDELAASFGLYQPAFRSWGSLRSFEQFEQGISYLRESGLTIPQELSPTYQDFEFNGLSLRLAVLSWVADSERENHPSWSLLVMLGTQNGTFLPGGIQLQVSNLSDILESPKLDFDELFLYATVQEKIGNKLSVTIISKEGNSLTLSPYTFASV